MSISEADFDFICKLVHDRAAIVLESGKEYLAESRLAPVARRAGLGSVRELVARLRSEGTAGRLQQVVIEAMTTNETSFFRDGHPFVALRNVVLPELMAKRAAVRQLTIWCCACSSGQEPYTIAMVLREHFPELGRWQVRLLASDISTEMLARTKTGLYSQLEVSRGLSPELLRRWFVRRGTQWEAKPELRAMLELLELNLAGPWPPLPQTDVVFLRNVLIYFDVPTKRAILAKVRRVLRPDGVLFLGGAETTLTLDEAFERVPLDRATAYRVRRG